MGLLEILTLLVTRVLLVTLLSLNAFIRLVSRILSFTLFYSFSLAGIPVGSVWLPYLTIEEIRDLRDLPEGV